MRMRRRSTQLLAPHKAFITPKRLRLSQSRDEISPVPSSVMTGEQEPAEVSLEGGTNSGNEVQG